MSKCKVCSKHSKDNPHIQFFRFPKDPFRCALWASRCNLSHEFANSDSNYFYKTYRICSDHFNHSLLYRDGHRAKLLQDALPNVLNNAYTANLSIKNREALIALSQSNEHVEPCLDSYNSESVLQVLNNLCRVCLVETTDLTMLFGEGGRNLDLPTKMNYIPIKLSENDVIPTKICQGCIKKVEKGYLFVQSCVEADKKLRAYIKMAHKHSLSSDSSIESQTINTKPCSSAAHKTPEVLSTQDSPPILREIDFSRSLALQNDYASMLIKKGGVKIKASHTNVTGNSLKNKNCNKFPCKYCYRNFQTLDILEAHAKAHFLPIDSNGNFPCDECGVSFRNRFHLSTHRRRHFNEKPYECTQCNARFYSSSLLRQHSFTHSPKQFSCHICSKLFLRKNKLLMHIQDSNHFYSQEHGSGNVKKTAHKCVTCAKSFSKLSSLQRHLKMHWPSNNFLCAFCGKLFTRMDSLTKHYRIHTGERPYSCYVCGFSFKQKGDCKKHEDNH